MAAQTASIANPPAATRASWFPMLIIALAQIQMGFNVSALPVSMGGIVEEFQTSPSSVGTALVVYSLAVAGLVMLGAKLGKRFGSRLMFQIGVALHGASMGMMALSTGVNMMIEAQVIAGIAAALLVPALVVMIAAHYEGKQLSQALGFQQASAAGAFVLAFLIVGILASTIGWRYGFGLIVIISIVVFILSFRLKYVPGQQGTKIDLTGAVLAALAISLISIGFDNLNSWGLIVAGPNAPFSLLGMSLAPLMIILGVVLGQAFFSWSHLRKEQGKSPLLDLRVLDSAEERAATFCMLIIGALGPAVNFLIPLYIQIVQGRSSFQTSVAIIPYSLAIVISAMSIVRFFDRFTPRMIGRLGFIVVMFGFVFLAFAIQNDWGTPLVITGLIITGLGEGALLTLMFTVLVAASPKALAGDVGALRGTVNNLSTAVGTAVAGAMAAGVLAVIVNGYLLDNPVIRPAVMNQLNLNNIDFVSNERLDEVMAQTIASQAEAEEATRINESARLRALKISFLVLGALALVSVFPAGRLPGRVSGDQPAPPGSSHPTPEPVIVETGVEPSASDVYAPSETPV
ncbi:MAG: MFS transporter [Anaerolineae bacterium]|nr:MFS transporter [Anaerolineae bacterium]